MATPPSPSRLLALPPEIRNPIWELSFSGTNHTVDLLTCHPPSLDLLLASRQVYEEAKGFWPGRRREFFSSTSFSVTRGKKVNVKAISFTDNDVKHIKAIRLYVRGCNIRHLGRMTKQLQEVLSTTSILVSDEVWTFKRRDRTSWISMSIEEGKLPKLRYIYPTHRWIDINFSPRHGVRCDASPYLDTSIPHPEDTTITVVTRAELSAILGRKI
ncbi:hypothetical protein LTR56_025144 [Elasticomyces elasticus]|nr:hypothetical protein LTR56_025144 [Elasticomyces elasticus]KAK3621299.1 hypothetical protein LTR22_025234 [Elasticomyces elasticus]KAK4904875.1 hypothetical protein LTR49_025766 [Elasticomyces elasticus]KAK5741029.1 hypothetical protein LTS12_024749 [Elasticomyces elasticus]